MLFGAAMFFTDYSISAAALAAQLEGKHTLGIGVLFGSNVFNIAALLGLGSLVAGRVVLHRRVVVLEGAAALGVAGCSIVLVTDSLGPVGAALVTSAVFVPYLAVSAVPPSRLPLPRAAQRWLGETVKEESEEVSLAAPPPSRTPSPPCTWPGRARGRPCSPKRSTPTRSTSSAV